MYEQYVKISFLKNRIIYLYLYFKKLNLDNREDFKKQKLLDEARKAGKAPALLDEEGQVINPHIPEYIVKAPCKKNE